MKIKLYADRPDDLKNLELGMLLEISAVYRNEKRECIDHPHIIIETDLKEFNSHTVTHNYEMEKSNV